MATFDSNLDAVSGGGGGGGGEDLAATLILGNVSGGTDIEMSNGDVLKGEDAAASSNNDGFALILTGGQGDGTGGRGPIQARTGGNTRGPGSVDLQQSAAAANQIAEAPYSVLVGGYNNRITNSTVNPIHNRAAVIVGGYDNVIQGDYTRTAAIVGGYNNTIDGGATNGNYCVFIGGGSGNTVGTYSYGTAVFGQFNTVDGNGYWASNAFVSGISNTIQGHAGYGGAYHAVAMGRENINEGQDSFTMGRFNETHAEVSFAGGNLNVVNGYGSFAWGVNHDSAYVADYSTQFGCQTYAYVLGQLAHGSSVSGTSFVDNGEAQRSVYPLSHETTNATPTDLTPHGTPVALPNLPPLRVRPNRVYSFMIQVAAYQHAGVGTISDSATWEISGAIKRDGSNNTSLLGLNGTGAPLFADAGASTWSVSVSADDTNEALIVTVTGEAGKTIRWSAAVYTAEAGNN